VKILVTVTEVSTTDDQFEIDGLGIPDRYLTYDLNEWDDYAVEEAVQYQEAHDDEEVEVVTVTVGPERAEETIRQALAKGADRAIRVWDDALADAPVLDPLRKSALLAAVAREEDPDLILSGVQSGDDAFGATGVATAAALDFAWAAVVNEVEIDADAGIASVQRELEGGLHELTEVELPAVLTIQTGINEPRYASLRGIRQAQSKPLDVLDLADLDRSVEDLPLALTVTDLYEPSADGEATLFEGTPEETADQLAALLGDQGVGA
jgi:electron transfer flavoprotein beta subunit